MTLDLNKWLSEGGMLRSSGSTGTPKELFQTPEKIRAANAVAIDSQELTKDSRVYTVCKTTHAGGLLAQTLPAYSIGADVVIEDFNAYRFVKEVHKYTHTHVTPNHARAIMMTKGFTDLDLTGIWVTCGSDPVTWDIIESFVSRGATFMSNWGMTEIGPCAINTVFRTMDQVKIYKNTSLAGASLLGDRFYCQHYLSGNELLVKGDICIYDDWYNTRDRVSMSKTGELYYHGRT